MAQDEEKKEEEKFEFDAAGEAPGSAKEERGTGRPRGSACDIGAYGSQP